MLSGRDDHPPESRAVGDGAELPAGRLLVRAEIDGNDSLGPDGEDLESSHGRDEEAVMAMAGRTL